MNKIQVAGVDIDLDNIKSILDFWKGPVSNADVLRFKYERMAQQDGSTGYFYTTDGYYSTRRLTSSNIVPIATNPGDPLCFAAIFNAQDLDFFTSPQGAPNPDTSITATDADTNIVTARETLNEDFVIESLRVDCRNPVITYPREFLTAGNALNITDQTLLSALMGGVAVPSDVTSMFLPTVLGAPGVTLENVLMQAIMPMTTATLLWSDTMNKSYEIAPCDRLPGMPGKSLYRANGLPFQQNKRSFPEGWRWMNTGVGSKFITKLQLRSSVAVLMRAAVTPFAGTAQTLPTSVGMDVNVQLDGVGFSMNPFVD